MSRASKNIQQKQEPKNNIASDFFTGNVIKRFLSTRIDYILLLALIILGAISWEYQMEKKFSKIEGLKKNVKHLHNEYSNIVTISNRISKQSEIENKVKPLGIKIPKEPHKKISLQ